ncbi:MAG: hypothetical protein K6E53_08145 [Lachnospiraceae bacterium]|nr:hypothetical protein [Lachnospiraceae bacterium]
MNKSGWLLYESADAKWNRWFIEKLQKECSVHGLTLKLVFTDYISDAYNMTLDNVAVNMLKGKETPDFIVNRSRHSGIAYEFEKQGIRIFNPAKVTETANDKELSYDVARALGLPFMPFITVGKDDLLSMFKSPEPVQSVTDTEGYRNVKDKADDFGYPFVLKPAEGHGGKHVFLINNEAELHEALQEIRSTYSLLPYKKLLMQRVASVKGCDLRVYLINNTVVTGMLRTSSDPGNFRANFSLGGRASVHTLTREERFLTGELADALPSDYMGIDFIYDRDGIPVFNEFEDVCGARMLYANTDIDIVRQYAAHIASVLSS